MATEDQIKKQLEEILLPALRQYQHNDGIGFVAGYDREEVHTIVSNLLLVNARPKRLAPCNHVFDERDTCSKCGIDAFTT